MYSNTCRLLPHACESSLRVLSCMKFKGNLRARSGNDWEIDRPQQMYLKGTNGARDGNNEQCYGGVRSCLVLWQRRGHRCRSGGGPVCLAHVRVFSLLAKCGPIRHDFCCATPPRACGRPRCWCAAAGGGIRLAPGVQSLSCRVCACYAAGG